MSIKETKKYEIGYLISPFITAEQIDSFVDEHLVATIKKSGGEITSRLKTEMRALAYPVSRAQNNKKTVFKDAYFGSLVCELKPADIAAIDEALKKDESVIRFLITLAIDDQEIKKPIRKNLESKIPSPKRETAPLPKKEVDKEEIDKEIEDLLATV